MSKNIENLKLRISKILLPLLIEKLLDAKIISKNVSGEELYLKITDYIDSQDFSNLEVAPVIDEELFSSIDNLVHKKKNSSALILAGSYLENIINNFYYDVLIYKHNFSRTNYEKAMKEISLESKFKWFYNFTIGSTFNSNLLCKINEIISKRNKLVHYKLKCYNIDVLEKDNNSGIDDLKEILIDIKKILNGKLDDIFPNRKISREIYLKYFVRGD